MTKILPALLMVHLLIACASPAPQIEGDGPGDDADPSDVVSKPKPKTPPATAKDAGASNDTPSLPSVDASTPDPTPTKNNPPPQTGGPLQPAQCNFNITERTVNGSNNLVQTPANGAFHIEGDNNVLQGDRLLAFGSNNVLNGNNLCAIGDSSVGTNRNGQVNIVVGNGSTDKCAAVSCQDGKSYKAVIDNHCIAQCAESGTSPAGRQYDTGIFADGAFGVIVNHAIAVIAH